MTAEVCYSLPSVMQAPSQLEWIDMVMRRLHTLELENTQLQARCSHLEELEAERNKAPTFAKFVGKDIYFQFYIPKAASPSLDDITAVFDELYDLRSGSGNEVHSEIAQAPRAACLFHHISLALNAYVYSPP